MTEPRWTVLLLIAALTALAGGAHVALADTELVIISVFTIDEGSSFTDDGDLDLPDAASESLADGWFEANLLWLYLDTNRPVTLTVEGYPYTLGDEEDEATLHTQLRGAHGQRDQDEDELLPFGWLSLYARVDDIDCDLPGRYKAWLQLQVERNGLMDRAGTYTATVTITVSH